MKIETCPTCEGTKVTPHANAGETRACFSCNGFGLRNNSTLRTYRTSALARRYGRPCHPCGGTGVFTYPMTEACRACDHLGVVVTDAHPGDVLPEVIGRCDSIPTDVSAMLAAEWSLVVVREDRRQTWGESYLGLGSIWSVTDYGARWLAEDDSILREDVRRELAGGRIQWIRVIGEDRVIVPAIVIRLTRGGYSVVGAERDERGSLPPTYSDELLSRPV